MGTRLEALLTAGCANKSCWVQGGFRDGGVNVKLGGGWRCFMADWHFSNKFGCLPPSKTKGKLCDGVALNVEASNRRVRLVEAKTGPKKIPRSRDQLRTGANMLLSHPEFEAKDMTAECHVKNAPHVSLRLKPLAVADGKALVPFAVYVDGQRVL
jgi:hypothetical protein